MDATRGDPGYDSQQSLPSFAAANNPTMQSEDEQGLLESSQEKLHKIIKPTRCRGCSIIVEPLLFTFMLSQFPMFILMPQYYQRREWERLMGNTTYPANTNTCVPHTSNNDSHWGDYDPIKGNLTLASSAASILGLQMSLASALPAIIPVLFLGAFSDVAGRKYAIIPPIIGQTLASLNLLLNVYFNLPLEFLLVGSFIYGCCGYWVTLFMGCISYITDITPKERRSFRIVMAEICVFAPTILSSAGSGFWVETLGFSLVFLIIAIFNLLLLLYAIFLIPETIHKDPSVKALSLKHIKKAISVFMVDDSTKRRWKLLTLLLIILVYMSMNFGGVETYFEMNLPLCWGSVTIGIFTAIKIGVSVFGSAFFAKALSFCLRDAWMTVVAIATNVAGNTYLYFVVSTPMMLASAVFNLMGVITTPTIRSMISKLVQPNEIGAAFSGVAVVEVLCGIVGSVILNPIYSATTKMGEPSAVFLVIAGAYLLALTLMVIYSIFTRNDNKGNQRILIDKDGDEEGIVHQ